MALRRRTRRRRKSAVTRRARPEPISANQSWWMDFMHDALADGRRLRIFTLIDVHTRECLALRPTTSFSGAGVAELLRHLGPPPISPDTCVVVLEAFRRQAAKRPRRG